MTEWEGTEFSPFISVQVPAGLLGCWYSTQKQQLPRNTSIKWGKVLTTRNYEFRSFSSVALFLSSHHTSRFSNTKTKSVLLYVSYLVGRTFHI